MTVEELIKVLRVELKLDSRINVNHETIQQANLERKLAADTLENMQVRFPKGVF
jgi:hypothetical protein